MPSKPAVQPSDMLQGLAELNIFAADGSLKKERNEVWSSALLQLKMKRHNLYITVLKDRHNLLTGLKRIHNLEVDKPSNQNTMQHHQIKNVLESETNGTESGESCSVTITHSHPLKVFKDLNDMKFRVLLSSSILHIFHKPLSIIYQLPEQKNLWDKFCKKKMSRITLIVLNDLIEKACIRHIVSNNLYLYALAIELGELVIPIFQTITDGTDSVTLNLFLREFLCNKHVIPYDIITQYSSFILTSLIKVFNEMSIEEFNEICYEYINKNILQLPAVIIRVDIYSILNQMYIWPCSTNDTVKKFYICCVFYLSYLSDHNIVRETLQKILIVSFSKYEYSIIYTSKSNLIKKNQRKQYIATVQ